MKAYCSPGGSDSKESACSVGDRGFTPGSGRFPEKRMATHSRFSPGKSHVQRRLAGYSQWAHKEPDTTERLTLHFTCQGRREST